MLARCRSSDARPGEPGPFASVPPMEARTIAKQIAYGRMAIGAVLMAKPDLVTRPWLGPVADAPGGNVLAVTFGARDFAVGAGTAYALHRGAAARPWLLAAVFTDAVDAAATFATRRALPSPGAPGTVALAATAAAIGVWTARRLS
jgi:hypothetical protein